MTAQYALIKPAHWAEIATLSEAKPIPTQLPTHRLSRLMRIGVMLHPPASPGNWVERVVFGHYAYSRRAEYRTCALAAAYAGAFGRESVERAFSLSQATFRLSRLIGVDLGETAVGLPSPLAGALPLVGAIVKLYDTHYWTREGIVEWLEVIGL